MNAVKLLVVIVLVLAISQLNEWDVLERVFFVLSALLVVALLWSRLSLHGLALSRETRTDRAQVGERLVERLRVSNVSRLPKLWVEVIDQSTLPGHHLSRVVHLGPHDVAGWRTETACTRRGRFQLGPLVLRSGDPFGLFMMERPIPHVQEVLVYPATVDVSAFRLPGGDLPGGNAAQRRTPFVTPNAASVRQYVPGDSFNRIAWSATARSGHLMVKEFELDPSADVWIVLDLEMAGHVRAPEWRLDGGASFIDPPWLGSSEEYAVTIAASVARQFLDENRMVGLLTNGRHRLRLPADRGQRQLVKILESLAAAQADGVENLAETLTVEATSFARDSTVVVVTPSTDQRWARVLGDLTARHLGIVAIVVEPSTFGGRESSLMVVSDLTAMAIPTYLVKNGDDIGHALATHVGRRAIA